MKHCLIDKVISSIELTKDRKAIKFNTYEEEIIAKADGDCCSDTWIETVELPALGFPAKVRAVEELSLSGNNEKNNYMLIQHYGLKIITDKGEIIIDYRNESNGYYGGSLCWPDESFYDGVYGQNVAKEEWEKL